MMKVTVESRFTLHCGNVIVGSSWNHYANWVIYFTKGLTWPYYMCTFSDTEKSIIFLEAITSPIAYVMSSFLEQNFWTLKITLVIHNGNIIMNLIMKSIWNPVTLLLWIHIVFITMICLSKSPWFHYKFTKTIFFV
jgi:hypothetical protein